LLIPVHVRAVLEGEFHAQITTAYTEHLNHELAALESAALQVRASPLGANPVAASQTAAAASLTTDPKVAALLQVPTSPLGANAVAGSQTAAALSPVIQVTPAKLPVKRKASETPKRTQTVTFADDAIVVDSDSDDSVEVVKLEDSKQHGLKTIESTDILVHMFENKSNLRILQLKQDAGTHKEQYYNVIHFLATVLNITSATKKVLDLLPGLQNIGHRKDVRSDDVIGFLTENGVKLLTLSESDTYEAILTGDHASPVIIEYSVLRHKYENPDLPDNWIQFCLLFKKEKLLVPFNEFGTAIILGNQFTLKKWTRTFDHYCKQNLNYRIAPVNRFIKSGPNMTTRVLHFKSAWAISMPPQE